MLATKSLQLTVPPTPPHMQITARFASALRCTVRESDFDSDACLTVALLDGLDALPRWTFRAGCLLVLPSICTHRSTDYETLPVSLPVIKVRSPLTACCPSVSPSMLCLLARARGLTTWSSSMVEVASVDVYREETVATGRTTASFTGCIFAESSPKSIRRAKLQRV